MKNNINDFLDWLEMNGYYIACYGVILTKIEIYNLLKDFKKFKDNIK